MGWGRLSVQAKKRSWATNVKTGGVVSITVNVSTKEAEFKHSSVATWVRFSVHRLSTHTESTVVV